MEFSNRVAPQAIELINKNLRYYMKQCEVIPRCAGMDGREFWIKVFGDFTNELRKEGK
jgi:hypothetical protein